MQIMHYSPNPETAGPEGKPSDVHTSDWNKVTCRLCIANWPRPPTPTGMPPLEPLARVAYEAHRADLGETTFFGNPLLRWDALSETQQKHWVRVVRAVVEALPT